MDKNLKIAKNIISQNKFEAEQKRDALLKGLDEDFTWKNNEINIRKKKVEIGLSKGQNSQKLRLELEALLVKRLDLLCERNLTLADLAPNYKCALCGDTGYFNEKPCECLLKQYKEVLFNNSNLIGKSVSFENSKETNQHNLKVFKKCQQLFDKTIQQNPIKNLTLFGKVGTGKTYLLNCIGNAFVESLVEVLFVTSYQLNGQFLKYHLSDVDERQKFLDDLYQVEVLIIDDLGVEQTYKNVTIEYLFAVINQRKLLNKTTLVSTNLSQEQMQNLYDDRIFSRLMDQTDTFVAELVGDDKRIK